MRLCLIANPNSVHTQRWVRFFAGRGHDVHLVGPNPLTADLPADLRALLADGRFHDLTQVTNRRKLRFVVWSWTLRRLVRRLRPDVLHAHQVTAAGWLAAATGYHPLLVTAWGSDLLVSARRSARQRHLAQWVLRCADYVTCVSQSLAEAARALGTPAAKVEVVHWGVDTEVFHPADAPQARGGTTSTASVAVGGPPTRQARPGPLVMSIRALRPIYNPLVVAQAIPAVLARRPDARFVVRTYSVDPALLAAFQEIVGQGGAAEAVEYVGDLPDDHAIADLYRQAAVVVSVPSSDGTPQSVLEAMACGAVPVLSDLPSLRRWVEEGKHGLYVPAGDATALANAVVRLLEDAEQRQAMSRAASELVRTRADSRVWMARYEQIYAQLAASRRPQPPWSVVEGQGQAEVAPADVKAEEHCSWP